MGLKTMYNQFLRNYNEPKQTPVVFTKEAAKDSIRRNNIFVYVSQLGDASCECGVKKIDSPAFVSAKRNHKGEIIFPEMVRKCVYLYELGTYISEQLSSLVDS